MKKRAISLFPVALFVLVVSCNLAGKNNSSELAGMEKERTMTTPKSKKTTRKAVTKRINKTKYKSYGISNRVLEINSYVKQKGYSAKYCFLIDMSLPSGKNRFFIYDLEENSIAYAALVAHGCCNETFISHPRFSNSSGSGCSSVGRYKVGEFYNGQWGPSFRLYGLDNSNSNAYQRGVVIHGHDCVEDHEIYPRVLCNSFGCPMVSYSFFNTISRIIHHSDKPILLWIYR